nr:MAG TPA: hypothetical protein [Bacteriophage sp.]
MKTEPLDNFKSLYTCFCFYREGFRSHLTKPA